MRTKTLLTALGPKGHNAGYSIYMVMEELNKTGS